MRGVMVALIVVLVVAKLSVGDDKKSEKAATQVTLRSDHTGLTARYDSDKAKGVMHLRSKPSKSGKTYHLVSTLTTRKNELDMSGADFGRLAARSEQGARKVVKWLKEAHASFEAEEKKPPQVVAKK